jgi:DNA-binding transcriptional ArsR family regulator
MATAITGLGDSGPGRPVPVVSALVEFGSALHALRDPGHHGATEWAARTSAAMSPRLLARTRSWWWTAQAIRATPFVTAGSPDGGLTAASPAGGLTAGSPDGGFTAALARLRALPAGRLARQLLRPISPSGDLAAALHWSRSRGPDVTAVVEALAARPGEAAADFVEFLETSWREWFSAEWKAIRPALAGRARAFAGTVSAHGAVAALTGIDSSVTATPSGTSVSIAKIQNARHDVSRRGLQVAPSVYIHPHLYVANVPGQPLLLIHPASAGPPVPTAAELLRRLGAMANPGRLEVARAIATEPRTAGEIATLWHVDATLVNRHLRELAAAGLARTTRRGRFVQYQLDTGAVASLGGDLVALLLR